MERRQTALRGDDRGISGLQAVLLLVVAVAVVMSVLAASTLTV
jgi:hypothetical protein